MYLAVLSAILGWATLFRSLGLLTYALLVGLCFHLFVVLYEEPHLQKTFGDSYDQYCARPGPGTGLRLLTQKSFFNGRCQVKAREPVFVAIAALLLAVPAFGQSATASEDVSLLVANEAGQGTATFFPSTLSAMQQEPGRKSPGLAGVLSFFIFPGTGSFYAGNEGHGVRHLVIGVVTLGGVVAGAAAADDIEDPGFAVATISLGLYLVNWIWGTVVAVTDAKAHNRALGSAAIQFAPELTVIESPGGDAIGLQLVRVSF